MSVALDLLAFAVGVLLGRFILRRLRARRSSPGRLKGWRLALASRVELVDTAVRVSEENRRLHDECAALKAALRKTVIRSQRQARELAELREFLSVVEIGDLK